MIDLETAYPFIFARYAIIDPTNLEKPHTVAAKARLDGAPWDIHHVREYPESYRVHIKTDGRTTLPDFFVSPEDGSGRFRTYLRMTLPVTELHWEMCRRVGVIPV